MKYDVYTVESDLDEAIDRSDAISRAQDDAEDAIAILEAARDDLKRHGCDVRIIEKALNTLAATMRDEITEMGEAAQEELGEARALMARVHADEERWARLDWARYAL